MGRLLRVTGSDLEKLTSSVLTVLTDQPKQKNYSPVCQLMNLVHDPLCGPHDARLL